MKRRQDGLRLSLRSEEEAEQAAEELLELVDAAGSPVVVMGHKNADPDAFSSAYVIRTLIRRRGYDARLVLPEGLSQPSKRLAREVLGLDPGEVEDEAPEESALAIVVDTASPEQLGPLSRFATSVLLVVIDHHGSNQLVEHARLAIYDPEARATAELVYLLATRGFHEDLDRSLLELLLAGIVYDTRHFILSNSRTLRVAAEMLDSGARLDHVLAALQSPPMELPERIARIKAAKRMHAIRAGNYIVVVTHVGAYEASAARALLDLGADLAIVVSERGPETRIIGRARRGVVEKLGIHLGRDVMEPLAGALSGGGGGHAQAAGATVRSGIDRVIGAVVEHVEKLLRSKGLEPQPIT